MRTIQLGPVTVLLSLSTACAAQVQRTTFRGWESLRLRNEFVQLDVTPQLGGRILGYQLGSHSFLWSNPQLQGQLPPASRLAPDGGWLNWGGDKLWPAPQGWANAGQWPGPPDPVLDGSPQVAKVLAGEGTSAGIQVTSPPDPKTGIQFSRVIRLAPGSSRVRVTATMTNISNRDVQWGIWTVTQLDAGNPDGPGWNPDWNTYMPSNANSHFSRGFQVLYGGESNPEIQPFAIPCVFKLHYMWIVGKVGLDSPAGWLANVDGSTGYLFVQRFTPDLTATYPDGSSVEVWTNGVGTIHAWGRTVRMQADPASNPYIVESELLGPLVQLIPGEHSSFSYDWYSANIGGDFPVLSCNDYGCSCRQFSARRTRTYIRMDGRFGVFYQGRLEVELTDALGHAVETRTVFASVSPLRPVVLDAFSVRAPSTAVSVRLVLLRRDSKMLGELAQAKISQ